MLVVALPTYKGAAMRYEIDAWDIVQREIGSTNLIRRAGIRSVTVAAELPLERLPRQMRARQLIVFRRHLVADLTIERCVMGNGYRSCDGRMASRAGLR